MLRRRFLLSFLPLPLLFLSVGLYAVLVLADLGPSMQRIVDLNLNSLTAAHNMREGAQQMYRGTMLSLQGADQDAIATFRAGVTNFEQNLEAQYGQIFAPGESNVTWQLQQAFQEMRSSGQAILDAPGQRSPETAFFLSGAKVKMLTEELHRMNYEAMRSGVGEIEDARRLSTLLLVLMMVIAILLWLVVCARVEAYRNSTAAAMLRAQTFLHSILAAMPDPVYVVTRELQVELKNAAAERVDEQGGMQGALPPQLVERTKQVLEKGQDYLPQRFQEAIVRELDHEPRYFLPKILVMRDDRKTLLGAAIVLEDVTQFRLLDELKSNFVSTVSHEIKTPLTSIRMAVHLLQEGMGGPLQPSQAALLKTAREDIERLLRLLNNLLDLAHFEHGRPQMNWEETSVCSLVDEAVNEVKTLAHARHLTLKVDCPDGLPDLYVDRARIHHVLRNLLTNAVKHSPEGDEILLSVALTENGGIEFTVRDRGPGIPEEYQDRIFERFFRVPGQKTAGTGLGLSIAREIILAHTGTIGCQSDPGRETTFRFCLPTATEHQRRLANTDSNA